MKGGPPLFQAWNELERGEQREKIEEIMKAVRNFTLNHIQPKMILLIVSKKKFAFRNHSLRHTIFAGQPRYAAAITDPNDSPSSLSETSRGGEAAATDLKNGESPMDNHGWKFIEIFLLKMQSSDKKFKFDDKYFHALLIEEI